MSKLKTSKSDCQGILVLNTSRYGGISDYLHYASTAMCGLGTKVAMVGVDGTVKAAISDYEFVPLWRKGKRTKNRLLRRTRFAFELLSNVRRFAAFIKRRPEKHVLIGGFFEYLAPLWAGQFRKLSQSGHRFGTIIHDPVRDYVVGPNWWHQRSIRAAYSFADVGFVHGPTDVVSDAGSLRLMSIPMGIYPYPATETSQRESRDELGIPQDAFVLLSFGHVRDGKNLDLLIRAIVDLPQVHLVVAGAAQSSGQKPGQFYEALATGLGVSDRCHFQFRFIRDEEVGGFHNAADAIALTYSQQFRSQSAALSTCVNYEKPCLTSSGPGPMQFLVQEYGLGQWVEPDSVTAIVVGLKQLITQDSQPDWARYKTENSWEMNARIVIDELCATK